MITKLTGLASCLLLCLHFYAQDPLTLADNTVRIEGYDEQLFYYGFHEGDQLIFDLDIVKGGRLSEVEISLVDSPPLSMEYEPKNIRSKHLSIGKTGIYRIKLKNRKGRAKVCHFKVSRVAAEGQQHFNSTVTWRTVYDTTYTTVQEDYLIRKDTSIHNLVDQISKANSNLNINGNKNSIAFTLPKNTVSWSYYIGVGQESQQVFEKAMNDLPGLTSIALRIPGYGLMAAIALNTAPTIAALQKGEDITFYIADMKNALLFWDGESFDPIKRGKVISDYGCIRNHKSGTYYVCLANDNTAKSVTVTVKVTAVSVTEKWGKRSVKKMKVSERKVLSLSE
jgi:hypothetical protein